MSEKVVYSSIKPLAMTFLEKLKSNYLDLIYRYVKDNPELIDTVTGFLLDHEKL